MKIHTLGTCAGTEPMPNRRHASVLLEVNDRFYCFDAGAGAVRTAYLAGFDITRIEQIFISHPHRDHVGGLPEMLWDIRKIIWRKQLDRTITVHLHLPAREINDYVDAAMKLDDAGGLCRVPHFYSDGVIFDDGNIRIEARHNFHIQSPEAENFTSYSFRISAEGKQIIYSGDVKNYTDLGDWLDQCDLLMMETGHHKASAVCAGLRQDGAGVKQIMFVHSGREILEDYEGAKSRADAAWGEPVIIAEDGCTYNF